MNFRPDKNKNKRPSKKKRPKPERKFREFFPLSTEDFNRLRTPIEQGTFIIFDIESTGGNPERNGITEISAMRYKKGRIENKFYSMVNPQCRIPPIVRKMTGIDHKMVKDAPLIDEVMPKFIEFIQNDILVSHNTIGDLKFLVHFAKQTCEHSLENFFLCTHLLTEKVISEAPDKSLKGLAKYFDFPIDTIHRADADAELTLHLFKEICLRLKAKSLCTIEDGIRLQGDIESGMRLGWAIQEKQLKNPPRGPGVFYLYGKNAKPLFLSSVPSLEQDYQKLTNYQKLPKRLLRIVLNSHEIKFQKHPNLFDAMLGEGDALSTRNLTYDPSQWHLRIPQVLFLKRDQQSIQLGIGRLEAGIKYAFGPVNDRKLYMSLIETLAKKLGAEIKKDYALFPLEKESILASFLHETIDKDWPEASKSRFSLKNILNIDHWRKVHQICQDYKKISNISLPRGINNLLQEIGIVIGPAHEKGNWLLYPIIHSRPQKPIKVSGDWKEWLKSSHKGKKLVASLKQKAGNHTTVKELTRKEFAQINSTLWLLYINKGRGNHCHYISVSELSTTV
ncbi:MAG: exonuclease domain-containing protein [Bdellovibrionota bacterium]